MTFEEAINFIHSRAWGGSKPGLSRTAWLLEFLGNPQSGLRFIHVAGTNGKGSTSAMLSSVLTAAGFRTGLYTSPYISHFNERIQIDGVLIDEGSLASITERLAPHALSMEDRPTEFELLTAIAMEFFSREKCDFVVLETGLGGRLDSTNVIESPLMSIITNVGLDHTRELGATVEIIAAEKSGIIKPDRPVVLYGLPENIRSVFERKCAETASTLISADFEAIEPLSDGRHGQLFSYKRYRELFLPLLGSHQLKNAAVALEAVTLLRTFCFDIPDSAVKTGLESTKWPARFEILSENPCFVLDGGHNPQCVETVRENLRRYFPGMRTILLFGVLAGKNYAEMAEILNTVTDVFVAISPPNPMALPARELAEFLERFNKPVFVSETICEGIEKALSLADGDSVICAVGSLYSAGNIREYFNKN